MFAFFTASSRTSVRRYPFSRSAHFRLLRPLVALLCGARNRAQMWLLGRSPVISVQFLQIQILTRSRDVSVQCQPTDSLAADLAHSPARPITQLAHNCPPNYAAGPELPRPIAQLATNPPQLATKRCKPSQPAPNLPKRFPNFTTHAKVLKFTNLLGSPPLSQLDEAPSIPPPGLRQAPSVPLLGLPLYLSPEHPPPDLQQAPSVPPLGSQRSQLSRAGFNRSPVTFHMQVSSDAQFRASAANPQSPRLHTAPTLRPHCTHTAPTQHPLSARLSTCSSPPEL